MKMRSQPIAPRCSKQLWSLLCACLIYVTLCSGALGQEVLLGTVDNFEGPDDLDLSGDIVYAVKTFDSTVEIRGVTFKPDIDVDGFSATGGGGQDWSSYDFQNGDPADIEALNELMSDIRCCSGENEPHVYTFDVEEGLEYRVQVLWGENGQNATTRNWDIAIEGDLAVDGTYSNGLPDDDGVPPDLGGGFGTRWTYELVAPDDALDIEFGQIDGEPFLGGDANYVVSAFIIAVLGDLAPTDITLTTTTVLGSPMIGDSIATIGVVDPNSEDTHTFELVAGEGDANNALFKIEGDELQTAASLEGELGNTLSIRLRATDPTDLTFEKTFELMVVDDADSDGLLDSWELMFRESLEDLSAAGDFDNDTVTDLDEFGLGTNPTKADTDGDGLDDAAERTAMTNPLDPDTDGDGLSDNAEVNGAIKTDPTKTDTDRDGFDDPTELAEGTDPNDPDNFPFRTVVNIGEVDKFDGPNDLDLDGDILYAINTFDTDVTIRGVEFLGDESLGIDGYNTTNGGGLDWSTYDFTDGEDDDNLALNELMGKIRCCSGEAEPHLYTFAVTPGENYKIQLLWGENGQNATVRIWDIGIEGELAVDDVASNGLIVDGDVPDTGGGEGTRWSHTFTAADDSLEIALGQIEGGAAGSDANYVVSGFILSQVGAGTPFEITEITRAGNEVTFTWNSEPGGEYAAEWSSNLIDWIELDDGVNSEGDLTSFVDEAPADSKFRYYRVREQ